MWQQLHLSGSAHGNFFLSSWGFRAFLIVAATRDQVFVHFIFSIMMGKLTQERWFVPQPVTSAKRLWSKDFISGFRCFQEANHR